MGPAVNLAFQRKFNERLESEGVLPFIDLCTCSLHPVHNGFRKCLEKFPFDVDQFASDIFQWFKLSLARREDYAEVQSEELLECVGEYFIRPVSSRWLTMEPGASMQKNY
jgi:hypothetical protein